MEEGGFLRHARGLGHRVGDDDDAIILAHLVDQAFDLGGGDRIERRARLVHQDHIGIDRHRARDHQTLLLAPGQACPRLRKAVLHFLPQAGAPQRFLDHHVHIGLGLGHAMDAGAVGDVFVNRFWKWIGLLEHHADARAQHHRIDIAAIGFLAVDLQRTRNHAALDGVVHAIDTAQERGLAAARGANESGDRAVRHIKGHIEQRLLVAIGDIDVARRHLDARANQRTRGGGDHRRDHWRVRRTLGASG